METKALFPSYVILDCEDGEKLEEGIGQQEFLGTNRKLLYMNQEEEIFLSSLCGKEGHLEMSKGVIRKGITEGPLMGMENWLRRIDRHKRLARLQAPKGQNFKYIPAGLEIVEKSL